jgi:hypothetical protein
VPFESFDQLRNRRFLKKNRIQSGVANQTVTRTAESDLDSSVVYQVLADPRYIPDWAPVFADSIERIDDSSFSIVKGGETFRMEASLHPSARAVDYIREMPNNRRGGAYIRVTPRPLGGSTIAMTVPVGPNTSEAEVGKTVENELASLIRLAQSS